MEEVCSFSFSKSDRILVRSDFLRISKFGEKLQNRHFIAAFQTGCRDRTRIGITVSKRVGDAVTRNRLKRLVREYFRLNRHRFTGRLDINIIAKKEAAALLSKEVFASLQNIFDQIARKCGD